VGFLTNTGTINGRVIDNGAQTQTPNGTLISVGVVTNSGQIFGTNNSRATFTNNGTTAEVICTVSSSREGARVYGQLAQWKERHEHEHGGLQQRRYNRRLCGDAPRIDPLSPSSSGEKHRQPYLIDSGGA
jgi:hypothetical protein